MRVLLSIKPEFADLIFSGEKQFEYRKQIFKQDVDTVVVYASSPVQKIIGEFSIEDIYHDNITSLWNKTKKYSGISLEYYKEYFTNKSQGYAIKVAETKLYPEPIDLNSMYSSPPPQSFAYIK
jgi:predicted transcriptional regulator